MSASWLIRVATFQEWRDVDKPFAFVAACRELVAAGDKNFITHLPISFDGRANGIAHLALIAKDRAAAEMVNLSESDERHDIYSEVAPVCAVYRSAFLI